MREIYCITQLLYMLWVMLPVLGLYNGERVHVQVGSIHEPDSANLDIMSMRADKVHMCAFNSD